MNEVNYIGNVNSSPFVDKGRLHAQSFNVLRGGGGGGGGGDGGTNRSGRLCTEFGRGVATAVSK